MSDLYFSERIVAEAADRSDNWGGALDADSARHFAALKAIREAYDRGEIDEHTGTELMFRIEDVQVAADKVIPPTS